MMGRGQSKMKRTGEDKPEEANAYRKHTTAREHSGLATEESIGSQPGLRSQSTSMRSNVPSQTRMGEEQHQESSIRSRKQSTDQEPSRTAAAEYTRSPELGSRTERPSSEFAKQTYSDQPLSLAEIADQGFESTSKGSSRSEGIPSVAEAAEQASTGGEPVVHPSIAEQAYIDKKKHELKQGAESGRQAYAEGPSERARGYQQGKEPEKGLSAGQPVARDQKPFSTDEHAPEIPEGLEARKIDQQTDEERQWSEKGFSCEPLEFKRAQPSQESSAISSTEQTGSIERDVETSEKKQDDKSVPVPQIVSSSQAQQQGEEPKEPIPPMGIQFIGKPKASEGYAPDSEVSREFAKMKLPGGYHPKEQPGAEHQYGGLESKESDKLSVGVGAESGRLVEYEYLPHPADIQFHSWGSTKEKAFEHMADCMFGYITNTDAVSSNPEYDFKFEVVGDDLNNLLYKFMDELLFRFTAGKQIVCKRVEVQGIDVVQGRNYRLQAVGYGEPFDLTKHPQGTEIKAITLASLQVIETSDRTDAYVIVDI